MRRRRWAKRVGWIVAGLVALNVLVAVLGSVLARPSGPPSSSYATTAEGLAAYADLLAGADHRVTRVRERAGDAALDPRSTLVVIAPDALPAAEARALRRFVRRGGRLVAGGDRPAAWLRRTLGEAPAWRRAGLRRAGVLAPVPEAAGLAEVRGAGRGSFAPGGSALPVLGRAGRTTAAVAALGRGRAVLLADPSPLQNRHLGAADNAAFGLALAGEPGRPVAFLESVHGFREATGLAAIPWRWRVALGGLVLAGLLFGIARGRRLGPPEAGRRSLPPPRSDYVRALASTMARTSRAARGAAPVQAAARSSLERRTGVRQDAGEERVRLAAERVGLSERELAAMCGGIRTDEEVMAVGTALARLTGGGP